MKDQRKENSVSIETLINPLPSNPDLFRWMVMGLWWSVGVLVAAATFKDMRDNYDERDMWLGEAIVVIVAYAFAWPLVLLLKFPPIRIRLD